MTDDVTKFVTQVATNAVCPQVDKSRFSQLAQGIAAAQAALHRQNLNDAFERLTVLATTFPNVSVVYDLLGNVEFIRRDLKAALKHYQTSLELEPENPATERMVQRIERLVGPTLGR